MNRITGALLVTFALCTAAARAQLPDSPTGKRGNALIAALRGGSDATTADFFRNNFSEHYLTQHPLDERVSWLRATIDELGAFGFEGADKTGPFSATLMGSSATGRRVEIRYAIEENEPHRITSLDLETSEPVASMTVEEMVAAADGELSRASAEGGFSGVALIARGDEVLFEKAYGLANRRYRVPNTTDTAFNLGSINKIFTKIAVAQLAAAGKLSFDDTIADHLPDYPSPDVAHRITIQQVATHTAGLGDIFTESFSNASKRRFQRPQDYFELFAHDPLLFEPGEGQRYSNGGYMVLGAVIEAASGQSYHDYIREHIFEPAGMSHTHPYSLDDATAPLATGYTELDDDHGTVALHENTFDIPYTGSPAGGGYSTVRHLLSFRNALVGQELLDRRYSMWVATNELPDAAPETRQKIGLGIGGGGPGVNAMLEMSGEWTVIVLTNLDPPAAGKAARGLRELTKAVGRGSD